VTAPQASTVRRAAFVGGLAAALLFAVLAVSVTAREGRPFPADSALHGWVLDHRTGVPTTIARVVTTTGSGIPAVLLASLAGWYAGGRLGWPRRVLVALGAYACVQSIRFGLSTWIARARPPAADWATSAGGYAFPSGHTSSAAVVAALFLLTARRRSGGAIRAALAVGWGMAVGLSRVYLGVHWPSDVLGSWLLVLALILLAAQRRVR
jgi:undecaprenyl-diphosphatase